MLQWEFTRSGRRQICLVVLSHGPLHLSHCYSLCQTTVTTTTWMQVTVYECEWSYHLKLRNWAHGYILPSVEDFGGSTVRNWVVQPFDGKTFEWWHSKDDRLFVNEDLSSECLAVGPRTATISMSIKGTGLLLLGNRWYPISVGTVSAIQLLMQVNICNFQKLTHA